ncbi:MAG: SCO family protein [Pseudomonadota bacterium]
MTAQDHNPRNIIATAIILVVALAAGMLTAWLLFMQKPDLSGLKATVFNQPRSIQPFELVDHHGKAFTVDSLKGHWSFVFFGYTHCPDVCPTTLSVLNSVAAKLAEQDTQARFVFLSVDPERDTPEVLEQFVSYFNGDFIGVTGEPAAIDALTRQLGVMHMRVGDDNDSSGSYLVDHTASVLLFDPAGRYHGLFSPPLIAAEISDEFIAIAGAY